jgi:hypothetical protein
VWDKIVSHVVNFAKEHIMKKLNFKEKVIYDNYQKRLKLYDEIISSLSAMTSNKYMPINITAREFSHQISRFTHILKTYMSRLHILNDGVAEAIIYLLIYEINAERDEGLRSISEKIYAYRLRELFCAKVDNALDDFSEYCRQVGKIIADKKGF